MALNRLNAENMIRSCSYDNGTVVFVCAWSENQNDECELAAEKAPLGLLGTLAEICCSSELTSNVKVHMMLILMCQKQSPHHLKLNMTLSFSGWIQRNSSSFLMMRISATPC